MSQSPHKLDWELQGKTVPISFMGTKCNAWHSRCRMNVWAACSPALMPPSISYTRQIYSMIGSEWGRGGGEPLFTVITEHWLSIRHSAQCFLCILSLSLPMTLSSGYYSCDTDEKTQSSLLKATQLVMRGQGTSLLGSKVHASSTDSAVHVVDRRVRMKQGFEDNKELSNCDDCSACYNLTVFRKSVTSSFLGSSWWGCWRCWSSRWWSPGEGQGVWLGGLGGEGRGFCAVLWVPCSCCERLDCPCGPGSRGMAGPLWAGDCGTGCWSLSRPVAAVISVPSNGP